jgi:DNA-binding response OmpR family regulator
MTDGTGAVVRDPVADVAPLAGPAPARDGWGESALVLADGEVRDRLVTELVMFGYRPLIGAAPIDPEAIGPDRVPSIAVVASVGDEADAWPTRLRSAETTRRVPLVWVLEPGGFEALSGSEHLCDEFVERPYATEELFARLRMLRLRAGLDGPDVVRRGPLSLNTASYQATLEGRSLDLTYMEYELLRLLLGRPGRVFTREEILSRVWRYDYYGGLRTVDVHVRRLRAKLGQDHARLIETVRGVGYRFTQHA